MLKKFIKILIVNKIFAILFDIKIITFIVTKVECENLLKILDFENSKKTHRKLDRSGFRVILHKTFRMTDDMLLDRSSYLFHQNHYS